MNHATLNVLNGPLKGRALPLHKREMTLGADPASDLQLEDYPGVAAHHARLAWDGGQFLLQDQNGAGVFADGRAIPRELGPASIILAGESIELGDFAARLWLPLAPPQFIDAPPQPPASPAAKEKTAGTPRNPLPLIAGFCLLALCAFGVGRMVQAIRGELDSPIVGSVRTTETPAPTASAAPVVPVYNLDPGVAATAKAATVLIARRVSGGWISGSGFVVGDARHIITNRHVVADDSSGQVQACTVVFYSGTAQQTQVTAQPAAIALAPRLSAAEEFADDLAVITLDAPIAAALPLGRAEDLAVATTVYAVGFPTTPNAPQGDSLPEASIRAEAVQRLQTGVARGQAGVTVIQLSGTVTHGNSGGPVVTERGEVVGVISRGDEAGTAYAIPAAYLQGLF